MVHHHRRRWVRVPSGRRGPRLRYRRLSDRHLHWYGLLLGMLDGRCIILDLWRVLGQLTRGLEQWRIKNAIGTGRGRGRGAWPHLHICRHAFHAQHTLLSVLQLLGLDYTGGICTLSVDRGMRRGVLVWHVWIWGRVEKWGDRLVNTMEMGVLIIDRHEMWVIMRMHPLGMLTVKCICESKG